MISLEISRESFDDSFFRVKQGDFGLQQYAGQLGGMIRKMSREFSSSMTQVATYTRYRVSWEVLNRVFYYELI